MKQMVLVQNVLLLVVVAGSISMNNANCIGVRACTGILHVHVVCVYVCAYAYV